ncbi:hypothetical protein ABZ513_30640, partial [Streptomyces bacillaris]|uniref:hypothetical protein n=1 Tax=Streptomyces bacillaris TaxID=68179 RepID=UPI00345FED29
VRHSDPMSEAAETRAKAAGLLAALEYGGRLPGDALRATTAVRRQALGSPVPDQALPDQAD